MPDDFLREEMAAAKAAIRRLKSRAIYTVKRNTDVRPYIAERPFVSVLGAAAGGIVAGWLVTPRRKTPEEKQRMREMRKSKRHYRASDILLRQVLGAISPAIQAFAAATASSLFHRDGSREAHERHNGEAERAEQPHDQQTTETHQPSPPIRFHE